MSALRVKRVLEGLGVGPTALADRFGCDKSTWSRFLSEGRDIKGIDAGACLQELLDERGLALTPDLLTPESAGGHEPPEAIMQGQHLSQTARTHFKLFSDPFHGEARILRRPGQPDGLRELYLPPGHLFVRERLRQAALTAGFVAVSGEPGSGKSTLLADALARADDGDKLVVVQPANIERRKLTAAHIASEIIRQLSEETIPRVANVRDAVAQQVLATRYEQGQRVVLVIDEAHELPHNTIKDLKRYHELRHGYAQLVAIILIGQSELRARFDAERNSRLREAIIRCQLITLEPMAGHVPEYIARRFEWVGRDVLDTWEEPALIALEKRLNQHDQQYPVLIHNAAAAAMNIGARRGVERVTEEEVDAVWAATPEQLQGYAL